MLRSSSIELGLRLAGLILRLKDVIVSDHARRDRGWDSRLSLYGELPVVLTLLLVEIVLHFQGALIQRVSIVRKRLMLLLEAVAICQLLVVHDLPDFLLPLVEGHFGRELASVRVPQAVGL